MAGQNQCVVGQLGKHPETLDYLKHIATSKVGASDGMAEQCVSCECHMICGTIECDRSF